LACALGACSGSPAAPSAGHAGDVTDNLAFCADQVNSYRAGLGLSPLGRSADLEAFAEKAARNDGEVHQAHHWFAITKGGGAVSAENEILWWRGFGVRTVIELGLLQMWQAGPGGEHYAIMTGPFSQIGCGIFVNGSEVTIAQDFR
jgi:hypothetical protein